jgi:outer membrane protein OmpA-like peptidoglycan-associated protein/tetratricopeptide (TPR) repeat protein
MKSRYFFYVFMLLSTMSIWSQKWVEQGHKQFQDLAYSDAIISLEKAVEKGFDSAIIYSELADSYYFNANYQASAKWYQLLFNIPKDISAIHYFRYAQSLKSIGNYAEATQLLSKIRNATFNENPELLEHIAKNSGRFKIQLVRFNSGTSDFGPAFYGDLIVFTSARDTGRIFKRNHSWTNQRFTDLYQVSPDYGAAKPIRLSKKINSKFNESSAVFTKDGLTMYFTRNNCTRGTSATSNSQTALLKICKAIKIEDEWIVSEPLPFCSDAYNTAHPALSFDEKTLYFASDMTGGFGQSDLYKVAIFDDGSFGKSENLGASINTIGRETFPFVSQDHTLYFASDGHASLGGLDIFAAFLDEKLGYSNPQNVGEPINSPMDDFGFIINANHKTGYFTSNRSKGIDDIYAFTELLPLPCETVLEGIVAKRNSKNLLSNIEIVLLDANANPIAKTNTDEKGFYSFTVTCNQKYEVKIVTKGFISQNLTVEKLFNQTTFLQKIVLQRELPPFQIGDDMAKNLALLPIYFDLGKFNIRPDAAAELSKINKILLEYPSITIEVRSHTDSRDTAENNLLLSEKRAKATVDWFIENTINPNRLSNSGYGESQLLNNCVDGVSCSETAHQINRRSEFIVTGLSF